MESRAQNMEWKRLPLAVSVAFVVSVITFVGFNVEFGIGDPYFYMADLFTGSLGILVGTLCFSRRSRFWGAIALLVLGVGFTLLFFSDDSDCWHHVSLVLTGGALSVGFYLLLAIIK